jgi:putative membrane protein
MSELPLAVAIGAVASWYVANAGRTPARVAGWRQACFVAGIAAVLVALASPVDSAAERSLTAHMAQHLLLTAVAAPLLVLGRPVTLFLRARSTRSWARRVVRSQPFGALTHPVAAWLAFVGTMYASHLGPLYEAALESPAWHAAEHSLFLAAALLFWLPVAGETPSPNRLRHGARLIYLALAIPAEGFLALAIFSADHMLYPAYAGSGGVADQRGAAALLWIAGDLVVLIAIVVAALAWKADEEARQRGIERAHDVPPTRARR